MVCFIVFLDWFSYVWYFFEDCVISTFFNLQRNIEFDVLIVHTRLTMTFFVMILRLKCTILHTLRSYLGCFGGYFIEWVGFAGFSRYPPSPIWSY